MPKANERQVGGTHYGGTPYQHWDWVADNNLNYFVGMATKYVCRWKRKDGLKDLEKAGHYIQKVRELHQNGIPYPPLRNPVHVLRLKEVYDLGPEAFAFCTVCASYRSDYELSLAAELVNDLIQEAKRV